MAERLRSENSHVYIHNAELFTELGFNRRERVGLWIADFTAAVTQNSPSEGGQWPSDYQIARRIDALGLEPEQFAVS
jgi:hypothetical protein